MSGSRGRGDRESRRNERDSILKKIRALLKLTVENGATEAEAMAAASKAADLMAKHDLSMDDIDLRESGTRQQERGLDPTFRAHVTRVADAIAVLVGARFWVNGSGAAATRATFFGLPHDVEVAGYLLEICENAMRRELEAFERKMGTNLLDRRFRSRKADAFLTGMALRLSERFAEMSATRKSTGNALIPLKDALIEEALAAEAVKLRDVRIGHRDLDDHSFRKGRKAGDRVGLSPGLYGSNESPSWLS